MQSQTRLMSQGQRIRIEDGSLAMPVDALNPSYNRLERAATRVLGQPDFRHQLLLTWRLLDREDMRVDCPVVAGSVEHRCRQVSCEALCEANT